MPLPALPRELTRPRAHTSQLAFFGAGHTWPGRRGRLCKVSKLLTLDMSILLTQSALQAQSYSCDPETPVIYIPPTIWETEATVNCGEEGGEGMGDPRRPSQPDTQKSPCPGYRPGVTDSKEMGRSCLPGRAGEGSSVWAVQPSCASLTGHLVGLSCPSLISPSPNILQLLGHTRIPPGALIFGASIPHLQPLHPSVPTVPNTRRTIPLPASPLPSPQRGCAGGSKALKQINTETCSPRAPRGQRVSPLGPWYIQLICAVNLQSPWGSSHLPRSTPYVSWGVASENTTSHQKGALSLSEVGEEK